MFDRLVGLETEYAIRWTPSPGGDPRPTNEQIYEACARAIEKLVPSRPGTGPKRVRFLANGGVLGYEFLPFATTDGLIEMGTPECRGPSEVVLYQRAQEDLLVRALDHARVDLLDSGFVGELALLKNCRDVAGHTYGAQENYDVEIARGPALLAWRAGLVALAPLALTSTLLTWAFMIAMIPVILVIMIAIGLLGLAPGLQWLHDAPIDERMMQVIGRPAYWVERGLWEPITLLFLLLYRACAFRALRRGLLPFLISRPLISGAGTLVADRFALSEKGVAVRRICRRSYERSLSIYEPGNLCKAFQKLVSFDASWFVALFRRRQRFQLGFSDSNMAQTAEYMKVATTSLVIDLIEAGALTPPRVRRPLRRLRAIVEGDHAAALALQRHYLEAARAYLETAEATPLEVTEVVARWAAILEAIEHDPSSLIGQLDWITKRELIDKAGTSKASRKKIDLRYHELETGYFALLERSGLCPILVTPEEARHASEHPPATTPARERARLIRNLPFSKVTVGWNEVRIGRRFGGQVIRLDDHRPPKT